jgi:uncharacterized protein DUF6600
MLSKRISSISPRIAILGAFIAIVALSGAALLFTRGGSVAKGDVAMQPRAARLERVDGSVGIARAEDENKQLDWTEASINTPVAVGDRIYARDNAHASIALTGRHYVRMNPVTSLDLLELEERRTQLALRSGSALFEVGEFGSDEFYEVATPCGAVDFKEPGLYQIGMDGNNAIISVLSGLAQVVGQEGSGYISKGQVFTLLGATAAQALVSRLAPREAGNTVDEYYRYRYPTRYDGRYQNYDAYLEDPFYYDPYRTSLSSQYLSEADIPGVYDLDYYGDWVDVNDYGHCWAPRVSAGWAPYRSGSWDLDDTWGPSWVSSEPWGWAPYHYGRWANVNQRWLWVPVEVRSRPAYSPATVAFIPMGDQIGWVPLGPREEYVPRYYDNFRPRYLASQEVVRVVTAQNTFVNFNAPGGVTVVPMRGFNRAIDPRELRPVDTAFVGRSRAVIDPFAVDSIRQLAIRRDDGRRRLKFDRREQDSLNTAVVASALPEVVAARGNIASRLQVEAVPEKRKANKLKLNEATQVTTFRRSDGLPQPLEQSQRMATLASRAEQGDKSARREMRQLMREEQRTALQQPQGATQQQAQQEQTRQQIKEPRRAERQQQAAQAAGQQATSQTQQQQMKQQRRAERQQAVAAGQQATGQTQQQQMKQQRRAERQQQAAQPDAARQAQQEMKQQRRAERQHQAAQPDAARQAQQQMKQQRRAERQQQAPQQQQMREQRKEQKRKPPEAFVQQQQRQAQQQAAQSQMAQQQREQFKAQRRAERQQQQAVSQAPQASPQAQSREQFKAQRRAERQQVTVAQPQAASPAVANPDKAQRKAEKAQRRPPQ